jgi:hypothetical protein
MTSKPSARGTSVSIQQRCFAISAEGMIARMMKVNTPDFMINRR